MGIKTANTPLLNDKVRGSTHRATGYDPRDSHDIVQRPTTMMMMSATSSCDCFG
jgi:hypothetical protein